MGIRRRIVIDATGMGIAVPVDGDYLGRESAHNSEDSMIESARQLSGAKARSLLTKMVPGQEYGKKELVVLVEGLTNHHWNVTIAELLTLGFVTKSGRTRNTIYVRVK